MASLIFDKIKDPRDRVVYSFDLSDFGAISSHEVTCDDPRLNILTTDVQGSTVKAMIGGGEAMKSYDIELNVEFEDGSKISRSARIRVEDL